MDDDDTTTTAFATAPGFRSDFAPGGASDPPPAFSPTEGFRSDFGGVQAGPSPSLSPAPTGMGSGFDFFHEPEPPPPAQGLGADIDWGHAFRDFDGWAAAQGPEQRQVIADRFALSTDPAADKRRFLVTGFLAQQSGQAVHEVSDKLESLYLPAFSMDPYQGLGRIVPIREVGPFFTAVHDRLQQEEQQKLERQRQQQEQQQAAPVEAAAVNAALAPLISTPAWQKATVEQRHELARQFAAHTRAGTVPAVHAAMLRRLWGDEVDKGRGLEKVLDGTGSIITGTLKAVPETAGAAGLAISDGLGITDSGSGTRLRRGVANLWDAAGQRIKSFAPGDNQEARDQWLDRFKDKLDSRSQPPAFEKWLAGERGAEDDPAAQALIEDLTYGFAKKAVAADHWSPTREQEQAYINSDRNPANAVPMMIGGGQTARELLADYVATGDPRSWEAFKELVTETDAQYKTRVLRWAAEGELRGKTEAARAHGSHLMADVFQGSAELQTDPVMIALSLAPALRGVAALKAAMQGAKVVQQTAKAASLARQLGRTAAITGAIGAGDAFVRDPRTSAGEVLEDGARSAAGGVLVHTAGTATGQVLGKAFSTKGEAIPEGETARTTPERESPSSKEPPASEKLDSRTAPNEPVTGFRQPGDPVKTVEERRQENARLLLNRPSQWSPPSDVTRVVGDDAHAHALRKAMLLADQVHGGRDLPPLEIGRNLKVPDQGELHGEYLPASEGNPATAAVDERSSRPLNVMLHEFGHHLSQTKFITDAQREAVYQAARDTLTHERLSGKPASHYRDYMMSSEETFVRAYAQWVAEKTGDAEALAELAKMQKSPHFSSKVWQSGEFKAVSAKLDEIFKHRK